MNLVPSNTTKKLHIQKDGWNMFCGQSFSNKVVENLSNFSSYSICKSCWNKYHNARSVENV